MSNVKFTKYECDFYEDGRQCYGRKKKKTTFNMHSLGNQRRRSESSNPEASWESRCWPRALAEPAPGPCSGRVLLLLLSSTDSPGHLTGQTARPQAAVQLLPGLCTVLSREARCHGTARPARACHAVGEPELARGRATRKGRGVILSCVRHPSRGAWRRRRTDAVSDTRPSCHRTMRPHARAV